MKVLLGSQQSGPSQYCRYKYSLESKHIDNDAVNSRIIETKSSLRLVVRYLTRNLRYIPIKCSTDKIEIAEYERLLEIKPDSDDIPCVLGCKCTSLLCLELVFE